MCATCHTVNTLSWVMGHVTRAFQECGMSNVCATNLVGLRDMTLLAVYCSVLQCAAVCCSVVQRVAVWCSVLSCVAVWCNVVQCGAVSCSVLQCVAVWCSVVQCVAVSR